MSDAKRFVSLGEVSNEEKESLKTHQEAFYAHYYAANVYRSQDSKDSFKAYMDELNLAEKELTAMETVLKDHQPSSGDRRGRNNVPLHFFCERSLHRKERGLKSSVWIF